MKWKKRTWLELIAIAAMAAMVFILAILQYQWTGQISRTEQQRLQISLDNGVRNFSQQFSFDLERLCESFSIAPEAPSSPVEARLIGLYSNWAKTTTAPGLLATLYIWKLDNAKGAYLESLDPTLDPNNVRFQRIEWPSQLEPVHHWVDLQAARQTATGDREAVYYPWTMVDDGAALVRPLFKALSNTQGEGSAVMPAGFLILQLSDDFLREHYFPELVERHFGETQQRSFSVVVRSAKAPYKEIYAPDPRLPTSASSPDATVNLFDSVSEEARRRGRPTLQPVDASRQWQLVVQHPSGSLDVAVTAWRRRNLIISFTLLAVLAFSVVLIFSVTRRAERLARLQIDFVAGVSHELCTPLAVINSAAENLSDGVASEPKKIREYGGLIREQGRRLERMVDQVLLFAAERAGRTHYESRPVEVAALVAESLSASESILRDAGFKLDTELSSELPLVAADPDAVNRCLDNLLSNAMKYSGANRWITVRTTVGPARPQPEVQVSVQDRGMGIPPADLPHVFEPFYRVHSGREGQTRGVGLGLYLVKRMMEAMGGRVSVHSEPGQGSSFTLHFPVVGAAEQRNNGTA